MTSLPLPDKLSSFKICTGGEQRDHTIVKSVGQRAEIDMATIINDFTHNYDNK